MPTNKYQYTPGACIDHRNNRSSNLGRVYASVLRGRENIRVTYYPLPHSFGLNTPAETRACVRDVLIFFPTLDSLIVKVTPLLHTIRIHVLHFMFSRFDCFHTAFSQKRYLNN